ncbi:MAG: DNA repair protein RecN [candidate division KSB1 bacterium]|nr:DNA repair protein RecN [candidate division KSB1 bacterium]MDZ7367659.1 DNA repair protein RecN [candidate division KSB1 bacterium]MDZ7404826.1 DNA repair protein RecN [candidate division KSB1 bacterium]
MLQTFSLHNYALVDRVELTLGPGLNVFTGETGAGKSILIGAMAALLGERAAFHYPRDPEKKAVIEGLFVNCSSPRLKHFLRENALEIGDDGDFLLRREFMPNGRSRAFINDSPISTAILDALSELLADMHGQHEHQSLLQARTHLRYLDAYGGLEELAAQVAEAFASVRAAQDGYTEWLSRQKDLLEKREFNLFQLQEIKSVDPQPGEEEILVQEERLLSTAEKRVQLSSQIYQLLYEAEGSVQSQLKSALSSLEELSGIDSALQALQKDCAAANLTLQEAAQEIQRYKSRIEFNPARLEEIRQRLANFNKLKRKYGGEMAGVFERRAALEASLADLENYDEKVAALKKQLDAARQRYAELCLELSAQRRQAAATLQETVPAILAELGMAGARFEVEVKTQPDDKTFVKIDGQPVKVGPTGIDRVEFFISANPGQAPAPLAKVASGGEISRIMLALKSILAERDDIPVLIFDEIDAGISGHVAHAVGKKLQQLAASHQIVCITHLPQIASSGAHHFLVEKNILDGKSVTAVRRLQNKERPEAIARLLVGEKISETHIHSARQLLAESGQTI